VIYLLLGALGGLSLFGAARALAPARPEPVEIIAALDARRASADTPTSGGAGWRYRLGADLAALAAQRGWQPRTLRQDLSLLGQDLPDLFGRKILASAAGFTAVPLATALLSTAGAHVSLLIPLWLTLAAATIGFLGPDLRVRRQATRARAEFHSAVSAFLDLVAMNLEGGRGIPEALTAASRIGAGPALTRIARTLEAARLSGTSPWAALAQLGRAIGVDELTELGAMLSTVAAEGAQVRGTLRERAKTLRARRAADLEAKAGGRTQSMLIAQILLALAFLCYLLYPAVTRILAL
jgi:Flp pilus assembly protein TadB